MASKTPAQIVKERFGTREDLVKAILKLTDSDAGAKSRLMGSTNKKLLRIHEVATEVDKRFGGKKGLVDAMAALQFPGSSPNPGWRTKMEGMTEKKLFELHRQLEHRARKAKA